MQTESGTTWHYHSSNDCQQDFNCFWNGGMNQCEVSHGGAPAGLRVIHVMEAIACMG